MGRKDRLLNEALELSDEERREVAYTLLASLGPDDNRTEEDLRVAVERRARRALAGEPGVSWSDARAMLERRFGSF